MVGLRTKKYPFKLNSMVQFALTLDTHFDLLFYNHAGVKFTISNFELICTKLKKHSKPLEIHVVYSTHLFAKW